MGKLQRSFRREQKRKAPKTMKVITLPDDYEDANKMFGLYRTTAFGGKGPESVEEHRKLGKLQDALEAISYEEDVPKAELEEGFKSDTRWMLNDGVRTIELEDAHHAVLKRRIFGADIPWLASVSRRVVAAYDLVDEAEEIVVEKPKLADEKKEAVA